MRISTSRKTSASDEKGMTLHELLQEVAEVVNHNFQSPRWVVAELSDVREAATGHCYLQLVEKNQQSGKTLATARATIWANRWWLIRDSFYQQTGQRFTTGLKVLIQVQVTMNELYGLSLNIVDVDPTYTLGEMARRRLEIIRQLESDGIIDMNRELPFPTLPQRIAVISAEGAAGFGDFMNQLASNADGLRFYCHLFPAMMQGQQTEQSVINALERIYQVHDLFDVVVIIRGGGATVDLASFDSYPLACNVAQFPLPVITGIGHDRDQNVLDRVAHTSVKTPTAAAALLIDAMARQAQCVMQLQQAIVDSVSQRMEREQLRVQRLANGIRSTHTRLTQLISRTDMMRQKVQMLTQQRLQREAGRLQLMERTIQMAQPDNILKRGFSITRLNGHAIKSADDVPDGATLQIQTANGTFSAKTLEH